jgi:hypothetical protein
MSLRPLLLVSILLATGCSAELTGELVIDGKPTKITGCRSGQVYNFHGVELVTGSGQRVRASQTMGGKSQLAILPGDGETLEGCVRVSVNPQNSTINDIKNIEGQLVASCTDTTPTVTGTVTFANCH